MNRLWRSHSLSSARMTKLVFNDWFGPKPVSKKASLSSPSQEKVLEEGVFYHDAPDSKASKIYQSSKGTQAPVWHIAG